MPGIARLVTFGGRCEIGERQSECLRAEGLSGEWGARGEEVLKMKINEVK